jgi:hypothetical protein
VKQYAGSYRSKAQEYISHRHSVVPEVSKVAPAKAASASAPAPVKAEPSSESKVKQSDFPEAPKQEPVGQKVESPVQAEPEIKPEPLIA